MRGLIPTLLGIGLAGATLFPPYIRADDVARATLEEAIRAHGGPERLARTASMTRIGKCDIRIPGQDKPVTASVEISERLPDQCRWSFVVESRAGKSPLHHAISGDNGWRSSDGGAPKELTRAELEEFRQRAYVDRLATLVPLAEEAAFELMALPPLNIGGNPAVGFKVVRKDRPTVKLYFDKETHLLAKAEWQGKYLTLDALYELVFDHYKEIEGIKLPTRQAEYREGLKAAELTFAEFKFVEKFDEALFTRP